MRLWKNASQSLVMHVGEYAPKIVQIQIDPQKIGDVVGQRGKTINAIIERTGVKIDITDEGAVSICGVDQQGMDEAMQHDQDRSQLILKQDRFLKVTVVSIKEFGAFVEFAPGKEGMVHISKISRSQNQPCRGCSYSWRQGKSYLPW